MFCCGRVPPEKSFNINVVITDVIASNIGGSIQCIPDGGRSPYTFAWLQNRQPVNLKFSYDQSKAVDVQPGEYEIMVTDATGRSEMVRVSVRTHCIPTVVAYEVQHASNDFARDGRIVATVQNTSSETQYLWSTGVVTPEPVLEDVRPGLYTVTPFHLVRSEQSDTPTIHACQPIRVESGK